MILHYIFTTLLDLFALFLGCISFVLYLFNILNVKNVLKRNNKPLIVFIHGSSFNESEWIIHKLIAIYYYRMNVYTFNHGYYFSNSKEDTLTSLTAKSHLAISNFINSNPKIKISNIILVGHSMGGLIAINLLEHLPNVSKVTTFCSPIHGSCMVKFMSTNIIAKKIFKSHANDKKYADMNYNSEYLDHIKKIIKQNYNKILFIGSNYDYIVGNNRWFPNYINSPNKQKYNLMGHFSMVLITIFNFNKLIN